VVGRSAPSVETVKALEELAADGAAIHVVRADIGSAEGIAAAWSAGPAELPWRGIIHAAGVLDDGPIRQVTAGRLSRVLWPKVRAAWQLHSLSVGQPLDFFVLFSSSASVFGSKGQASYASANAYLDGLAQARLAQGLPALSINWGPWGEVGMAARLGERERDRWASQGLGLIDPVRGIAAFEAALRQIGAQSVVLPVDWGAFGRQFAAEQVPPLLREVVTAPTAHVRREARPAIADLQARLASASLDERKDIVRAHVREQVARVLGTGVDDVGDRQLLTELGMDSLMAVELSNRLTASTGQRLSPTLAFDCPTVDAIAAALTADAGAGSGGSEAAAADRERATPDALLARLPSMSEEEMDALLQQMLPGADNPRRRG
jgi:acyl carrier protein